MLQNSKAERFNAIQQQLTAWQQAAAWDKSRNSFSTPMPQIPQSVIEECKKSKQWMLRRNYCIFARKIAGAAAAASGPSGKTNGTEQQLLLGLFSSKSSSSRTTGVPNA